MIYILSVVVTKQKCIDYVEKMIMVILLCNLYFFVWIQQVWLANSFYFGFQQKRCKEVAVYLLIYFFV